MTPMLPSSERNLCQENKNLQIYNTEKRRLAQLYAVCASVSDYLSGRDSGIATFHISVLLLMSRLVSSALFIRRSLLESKCDHPPTRITTK